MKIIKVASAKTACPRFYEIALGATAMYGKGVYDPEGQWADKSVAARDRLDENYDRAKAIINPVLAKAWSAKIHRKFGAGVFGTVFGIAPLTDEKSPEWDKLLRQANGLATITRPPAIKFIGDAGEASLAGVLCDLRKALEDPDYKGSSRPFPAMFPRFVEVYRTGNCTTERARPLQTYFLLREDISSVGSSDDEDNYGIFGKPLQTARYMGLYAPTLKYHLESEASASPLSYKAAEFYNANVDRVASAFVTDAGKPFEYDDPQNDGTVGGFYGNSRGGRYATLDWTIRTVMDIIDRQTEDISLAPAEEGSPEYPEVELELRRMVRFLAIMRSMVEPEMLPLEPAAVKRYAQKNYRHELDENDRAQFGPYIENAALNLQYTYRKLHKLVEMDGRYKDDADGICKILIDLCINTTIRVVADAADLTNFLRFYGIKLSDLHASNFGVVGGRRPRLVMRDLGLATMRDFQSLPLSGLGTFSQYTARSALRGLHIKGVK
jgi:hypothetical protein